MSGIIGSITPGRIAFALGTVGVGALVGGLVADHRDADVGTGALVGGASALAGLALIYGGHAAWKHLSSGRAAAATGAGQLGTTLGATIAKTTAPAPRLSTTLATQVQSTASRLLDDAAVATANVLRPVSRPIPMIAATPALPAAASSGSTFLSALGRFMAP